MTWKGSNDCSTCSDVSPYSDGSCDADLDGASECATLMKLVCKEDGVAQSYAEAGNDGCDNCHVIWVICGTSCNYCGNAGGIVCTELHFFLNAKFK